MILSNFMPPLIDKSTTAEIIVAFKIRKVEMILNSFFIHLLSLAWKPLCGLKTVVIWKKMLRFRPVMPGSRH